MATALASPFTHGLADMEENGSGKCSGLRLRKALLRRFQEDTGNAHVGKRLQRYTQLLSNAYDKVATNKLKMRFRVAVHNDDFIALYSLSLTLQKKQVFSFSPYQEGVLNPDNMRWLKNLAAFLQSSEGMKPGTEAWCEQVNPLLDINSPCLGGTLQLIDELQWDYYLAIWEPYQQALEFDRHNLYSHDPRLCLLACWVYEVPVYLD